MKLYARPESEVRAAVLSARLVRVRLIQTLERQVVVIDPTAGLPQTLCFAPPLTQIWRICVVRARFRQPAARIIECTGRVELAANASHGGRKRHPGRHVHPKRERSVEKRLSRYQD